MKSEPATVISTITAFVTAVIGVAAAFGLDIDEAQRNAILAVIAPTVGAIFALGFVIRQFVVSPQTAANAVVMAKQDTSPTPEVPAINGPAGGAYADIVQRAGYNPVPPPAN